jgi:hypothetical protein
MRKKMIKLLLGVSILAGSLMGLTPKTASAGIACPTYCCNASCTSIRQCFSLGGSCVCREYCQPNTGGLA